MKLHLVDRARAANVSACIRTADVHPACHVGLRPPIVTTLPGCCCRWRCFATPLFRMIVNNPSHCSTCLLQHFPDSVSSVAPVHCSCSLPPCFETVAMWSCAFRRLTTPRIDTNWVAVACCYTFPLLMVIGDMRIHCCWRLWVLAIRIKADSVWS